MTLTDASWLLTSILKINVHCKCRVDINLLKKSIFKFLALFNYMYRRGGVVVRASASQSVDLGFISLVESYQKTLKNGIHSFPAWRSAHKG